MALLAGLLRSSCWLLPSLMNGYASAFTIPSNGVRNGGGVFHYDGRILARRSLITYEMSSPLEKSPHDPDVLGVYVDGFPLPSIPVRDDDEELLRNIRRIPLTDLNTPLEPRSLTENNEQAPLRVLIAGGGLGGLALASQLIQLGMDVHVFEQVSRYKPFGGPIQLQSNALWALREISPPLFEAARDCGVQTGDRLSGIKDGKRYEEGWLVKFDAATPALAKGLPLTLAINRVALQEIFLKYGVPRERIHINHRVVSYENLLQHGVSVSFENGETFYGDILVGADGIWSRVRHQMLNLAPNEVGPRYATKHASYSGYTCFTGTCRHTPDDIDSVAYKVFLGQKQYLGSTDAGNGWQHWWAFLPDPPGTATQSASDGNAMLSRLKHEFRGWSPEIHDLFQATNPEVVKQREIYDRPPMFGWTQDCVTLLGDACHPTMPNLGQGGAMAMEDAYVLGQELQGIQHTNEIPTRLKKYEGRRFVRASIAQLLSRNGSNNLDGWERLRTTPLIGPFGMWCVKVIQPITMSYLYSANF